MSLVLSHVEEAYVLKSRFEAAWVVYKCASGLGGPGLGGQDWSQVDRHVFERATGNTSATGFRWEEDLSSSS